MSKAFGKDSSPSNSPMRNTWDHTFVNHLTARMGCLHPILVKEVLPGDSVRLTTTFGLRFMPLYFPVQTRMRAYVHYFYVRNRNLWDDWQDFISNTKKNLVRPYFAGNNQQYRDVFRTGQLGDYLGLPTTIVGGSFKELAEFDSSKSDVFCSTSSGSAGIPSFTVSVLGDTTVITKFSSLLTAYDKNVDENGFLNLDNYNSIGCSSGTPVATWDNNLVRFIVDYDGSYSLIKDLEDNQEIELSFLIHSGQVSIGSYDTILNFFVGLAGPEGTHRLKLVPFSISTPFSDSSNVSYVRVSHIFTAKELRSFYYGSSTPVSTLFRFFICPNPSLFPLTSVGWSGLVPDHFRLTYSSPTDISKLNFRPYGTGSGKLAINCEVARAYESIYNAFYRDERNNPLIINGQPEYQKFLVNTAGGSDTSEYRLRYRNWEQDMYTTAVPSPQQGLAPLVGIESNGVATFLDPDSDKEYQVQLVSSDGENIDSVEYLEKIPKSVARSLVNVATSGISINTFRNVNSYQRWLETNIRKGFKYKDQIKGHYGVDVAYNILDMPEFIGGVTEDIQVQQINQNSQSTDGNPLGSYAGQAYAVGKSRNSISKYFDEHGYLIGILCIAPVPSYSQLLPKHFLKRELLDIYFPEFGKIGYQPITYSEITPLQTILSGGDVNEVFGYQRPWYDYLGSVDEVHGEFRTTLRDFLINRVFDRKPYLGPDFTVMNDSQMNNIFSVQSSDDKILGQILFDMQFKRPIPKSGIASLE